MNEPLRPTPLQAALYTCLQRRYGQTTAWQMLTKSRRFERMTSHRAAHFLARLLGDLAGHAPTVPCGCTGHTFASHSQKHPLLSDAPAAEVV